MGNRLSMTDSTGSYTGAVMAFQPFDEQVRQIQKRQHFDAVGQGIPQRVYKQFHKTSIYFLVSQRKLRSSFTAGRTALSGILARKRATVRAEKGMWSVKVSNPMKYCR